MFPAVWVTPGQQENIHSTFSPRQEGPSAPQAGSGLSVGWCLSWLWEDNKPCLHPQGSGRKNPCLGGSTARPTLGLSSLGVPAGAWSTAHTAPRVPPMLQPRLTIIVSPKLLFQDIPAVPGPHLQTSCPKTRGGVWWEVAVLALCLCPRVQRCSVGTGSVLGNPH